MGKSLFTKIAEWISGEKSTDNPQIEADEKVNVTEATTEEKSEIQEIKASSKTEAPAAKTEAKVVVDDSIAKKGNLLSLIIKSLKSNYAGSSASLAQYTLRLWVNDNLFYNSLVLNKFGEELTMSIDDELGLKFNAVEIKCGNTPGNEATEIVDGCYLQIIAPIQEIPTAQPVSKATIYSIAGYGSMVTESVSIDSHEIKQLAGHRYNIGIGKQPFMDDGTHRDNHIAINDDPSATQFENNRYVSRAHAHIRYTEELGFVLYVEHGGSKLAGKRTHIHRGGEKIELCSTIIPEPLMDGDYIVLSKKVHLLFKKA